MKAGLLSFTTLLLLASQARAECTPELKNDLEFLGSQANLQAIAKLKKSMAELPGAPASAKNKNEGLFCAKVYEAHDQATQLASAAAAKVSKPTLKKLDPYMAYGNGALNLTSLKVNYCESSDCKGSLVFDASRCKQAVVQGQVDTVRREAAELDKLTKFIADERRNCGMTALRLDPNTSVREKVATQGSSDDPKSNTRQRPANDGPTPIHDRRNDQAPAAVAN